MTDKAIDSVRRRYIRFADDECANGYAPHYDTLARSVADDEMLLAFLAQQPNYQPNLFFAAAQLLRGPAGMPHDAAGFHRLLKGAREQVVHLMRTRRTQTNEVGRAACWLPALPQGPLALLEVGASAGLVLNLDHYGFDYGSRRLADAQTPCLSCTIEGDAPLPTTLPNIIWRRGLDLQPVDLRKSDDVDWLLACVWPDHPLRRARLEAAIARARDLPVLVQSGDLTRDVESLLSAAPPNATVVVFHSAVLAYVARDRRSLLAAQLVRASKSRPIVWLSNEVRGVVPEITALAAPEPAFRFLLGRTWFLDGERRDELLGYTHPHGDSMEWVGERARSR